LVRILSLLICGIIRTYLRLAECHITYGSVDTLNYLYMACLTLLTNPHYLIVSRFHLQEESLVAVAKMAALWNKISLSFSQNSVTHTEMK